MLPPEQAVSEDAADALMRKRHWTTEDGHFSWIGVKEKKLRELEFEHGNYSSFSMVWLKGTLGRRICVMVLQHLGNHSG
eukprot:s961_g10.t1